MFNDIVGNTNPVFEDLPDADDIQVMSMYLHPGQGFFNIKQQMLQNNKVQNAVSECLSYNDEDKIDYDEVEYEQLSMYSEEQNDTQMMIDFIHLRPINGEEIGGVFNNSNRRTRYTNVQQENEENVHMQQ